MWQVVKGKRNSEYFGNEIDMTWLEKSDGAALVKYGIGREKQEDFFFQKDDLKFYFQAHRWNLETNTPTDVYIVPIKLKDRRWPISREENEKAIVAHAKDIESGLLAYPLHRNYQDIPVKEVLFDVNPIGYRQKLVHAEEVR